jgi:hypothetical protein
MANRQGSPAGPRISSGPLITGVVLAGVGSLLGLAGLAIAGTALVSAARRWVADMDTPPGELARKHWTRAKAATAAGASAWRNGTPAGASRRG